MKVPPSASVCLPIYGHSVQKQSPLTARRRKRRRDLHLSAIGICGGSDGTMEIEAKGYTRYASAEN